MKKSMATTILALIFLFPGLLRATDVGGIISSDTVWDLAHSPYTIVSEVQVADTVTLTIEPGVVVTGVITDRVHAPGLIKVWGTLIAVGTECLNITFNATTILTEDNALNGVVNIQFSHFMSSPNAYAHIPGIGNATLTLLDSTLEDSSIMVIGLRGDSRIERNVFVNSHHNAFGSPWDSTRIYVTNNVFVQCSGDYVVGLANYSGMSNSQIIFEYNSFLTTNKVALKDLTPIDISVPGRTFNPYILVAKNYWGTTDTRVIDSMIYDRNDDLECFTYFRYQPFLTQPHPDTPSLSEAPLANFTANPRSGINPLTVNFIDQSTGNITNRSWNFGDGATSESQNPSHTYFNPGIFTVNLTVIGVGGANIKIKPDYITVKEAKATPWLPLLLE